METFKTIAAGGPTWAHRIRMLRQVIRIGFLVAIILSVIYLGWFFSVQPTENYKAVFYFGKAKTSFEEKVTVDASTWREIQKPIKSSQKAPYRRTSKIGSAFHPTDHQKNKMIKVKKEKVMLSSALKFLQRLY